MSAPVQLTVGQFSDSAVIHVIRHLGLDEQAGITLDTTRVPSSPGQFTSLRNGEIDVAVTSPDNVLLYATTDQQPLGEKLAVTMLRTIDRGLGLALFTRPDLAEITDLRGKDIGVDVVRSGFALLLFRMLARFGIDRQDANFVELGSTPKRLVALTDGDAWATILNAESRVGALAAGMREWATSADISENYLGTVLAVRSDFDPVLGNTVTQMWSQATEWLLDAPSEEARAVLTEASPVLGSAGYVDLLRDPRFGLLRDPRIAEADLEELCRIRREAGAYAPTSDAVASLAHQ